MKSRCAEYELIAAPRADSRLQHAFRLASYNNSLVPVRFASARQFLRADRECVRIISGEIMRTATRVRVIILGGDFRRAAAYK